MAFFPWLITVLANLFLIARLHNVFSLLKNFLQKAYRSVFGEIVSSKLPSANVHFRDGWLEINGLASHVLTWGGWIEDPLPEGDTLFVFMGGVPGITLFYYNFLESLHILTGIPVWTICIPGHELPPPSSNCRLPRDSTKYNNVRAQIAHKIAFFKQYVPKKQKVYLIGHSLGTKMVLELLKDDQIRIQTEKTVLLMPTIEGFREVPRAKTWIFFWKIGFVNFLGMISWASSLMPVFFHRHLCLLYLRARGLYTIHENLLNAMMQFWYVTNFYNIRTLAWDELDEIIDLDKELLMNQKDKMKVYFAQNDSWAPLTHYRSLRAAIPDLPVEILDKKFRHAFTLATAEDMAELLAKEFKSA